jgi:hypothetical protein
LLRHLGNAPPGRVHITPQAQASTLVSLPHGNSIQSPPAGPRVTCSHYGRCRIAPLRNRSKKLSTELIQVLETCQGPGNVRELWNAIERLVLTSDGEILKPRHLPSSVHHHESDEHSVVQVKGIVSLNQAREMVERKLLS